MRRRVVCAVAAWAVQSLTMVAAEPTGQCLGTTGFLEGTSCSDDSECNLKVCVGDDRGVFGLCGPDDHCHLMICRGGFCDGREVTSCLEEIECPSEPRCYNGRCVDKQTGDDTNTPCASIANCVSCLPGGSSDYECVLDPDAETVVIDKCEMTQLECGPAVDLAVEIECGPGGAGSCFPAGVGDAQCEVRVRHLGAFPFATAPAEDVLVRVELPAGLQAYCSGCGSERDTPHRFDWRLSTLAAGATEECVFALDSTFLVQAVASAKVSSGVLDKVRGNNEDTDRVSVRGGDFGLSGHVLPFVAWEIRSSDRRNDEGAFGVRMGVAVSRRISLELGASYLSLDAERPSGVELAGDIFTLDLDTVFRAPASDRLGWLAHVGPGWRFVGDGHGDGFAPSVALGLDWRLHQRWFLDGRVVQRWVEVGTGDRWVTEAQLGFRLHPGE